MTPTPDTKRSWPRPGDILILTGTEGQTYPPRNARTKIIDIEGRAVNGEGYETGHIVSTEDYGWRTIPIMKCLDQRCKERTWRI